MTGPSCGIRREIAVEFAAQSDVIEETAEIIDDPDATGPPYAASKMGLIGLTRTLNAEPDDTEL